jgi:hypothetical protein
MQYVTREGMGIDNAQVQAFLAADYVAGRTGAAYVVGESKTKADGRWVRAMKLDPGAYTVVFFKQAAYGPDERAVTVSK